VGENRTWIEEQMDGLPVPVIFTTMQARPDVAIVAVDNYAGGRMATEHLLGQGYRHVAHISGPLDWWEARRRQAGWRDAMLAAGVPEAGLHSEEGDWFSASGERAIGRLLERYPQMEAVFVANDQMALGVLQAACRQGIQVPGEMAVVGFDGLPEAAHYWPPLTTVYQDLHKLGCSAVRELVRAIEAGRQERADFEPTSISLCPELIVRESTALAGAPHESMIHAQDKILSMETN
jgi:DNA-binding LacI/PurR family transcriptional regulator